MKIRYYILGIILSAALGLAGCKDDDDEVSGGTGELHLSAQIEGMAADEAATRFRAGQGVGMWLSTSPTDANLNRAEVARNVQFLQSAGGLVSDPRIFWNRQPSLELYAYAPYDTNAGENPAAYAFSVNPRQDSLALLPEGNEKNDLLYAKQTVEYSNQSAKLSFRHLMSKVVLHIHSSSSTPGGLIGSQVKINNVLLNASVDLGTGIVTARGDAGDVVSAELKELPAGIEIVREAIIVPQKMAVGTQFLEILTLGNYTHVWHTEGELNFESGKQIVLDVLVEETECVVRIKEIAPWRDNETIMGDALEELPTYRMFDFYNRHGIQGIVINVDETGQHGWVVSLDEVEIKWCVDPGHGTGNFPDASSYSDAWANLEAVRAVDPSLEDYPAFKWCEDKNVNGLEWVLPAFDVLKLFGQTVVKNADDCEKFNSAIQKAPVDADKKDEVNIDRTRWQFSCYYYSSTLNPNSPSGQVRCCAWDGMQMMYQQACYREMTRPQDSTGSWNSEANEPYLCRVRAFHAF